MGDKRRQGRRQTHHPTKGNKKGHKGRQELGKAETPSNTGTHVGRQWQKIGDKGGKTSGRRTRHPTQAHLCGETRRDKTSGRRAHHPRKGDKKDGAGWCVRLPEVLSPILSRSLYCLPACVPVFGWCVPLSPIVPPTCVPVLGSRGLVSPCLPLSPMLSPHVCLDGVSAFSRSCLATRGEKTSGRQTHNPTKGNKQGHKGRQDIGKAETPSNTGTHAGRQWETKGSNGRQDLRKVPVCVKDFFPFRINSLQCRINSLSTCSMLNLEAVISTILATFWNHFCGTFSILEQETDGKSSITELETFILVGIGNFWS